MLTQFIPGTRDLCRIGIGIQTLPCVIEVRRKKVPGIVVELKLHLLPRPAAIIVVCCGLFERIASTSSGARASLSCSLGLFAPFKQGTFCCAPLVQQLNERKIVFFCVEFPENGKFALFTHCTGDNIFHCCKPFASHLHTGDRLVSIYIFCVSLFLLIFSFVVC